MDSCERDFWDRSVSKWLSVHVCVYVCVLYVCASVCGEYVRVCVPCDV